MKIIFLVIFAVALVGCSTQPKTIVTGDLDEAVIGAKPEGYPKTLVKALPDQPGFCVAVTEDWEEHRREGQTVWLKAKTVESVGCTKTRWERLSMGNYGKPRVGMEPGKYL